MQRAETEGRERYMWDCRVGGCVNPTVSFEMEGVARIRGKRSDVLGEHTRTSTGYGIKKKKRLGANDYYLFKRKLPSVGNFS